MKVEPMQPTTDDPELAKVISGVQDEAAAQDNSQNGLQFEEAPLPQPVPTGDMPSSPIPDPPVVDPSGVPDMPPPPLLDEPSFSVPQLSASPAADSSDLESIKKDALSELRPLVERLELPAEEKFDIMLLIIRSNDDSSLLSTAHTVAKQITDDTKRAQALLDVIKEIDYFTSQEISGA